MAVLLDKLSQRSIVPSINEKSPMKISESVNPASELSSRVNTLPSRGPVGSMEEFSHESGRFVADIPKKEQLDGINSIIGGKDSPSPIINNFVRGMSSQGKSPEEIRLAFIEHQKSSPNPILM